MTTPDAGAPVACPDCRRRARLLAAVSDRIDRQRRDPDRLAALIGLPDHELVRVLESGDGVGPASETRARRTLTTGDRRAAPIPTSPSHRPPIEPSLCRHREGWPVGLRDLGTPPAVLHLGGSPERASALLSEPCVAIVGARRSSDYGRRVARRLAGDLAGAGVCVVSGMAAGIDAAAHAGALDAGGSTVAVLAGGVDVVYPRSAAVLHRRLRAAAVIVSELPAGASIRRWAFVTRNRLIAALAQITIVVEAAERSGALITVGYASDIGRDVAAVPGPVTAATSAGTNALLHDGAHLVRDAQDVLDLLLGVGAPAPRRPGG